MRTYAAREVDLNFSKVVDFQLSRAKHEQLFPYPRDILHTSLSSSSEPAAVILKADLDGR